MTKLRPEDYVMVPRRQLTKMISKLTYPSHCLHSRGDAAVCDGCHYTWERRAMEVRGCLLVLCKYPPKPARDRSTGFVETIGGTTKTIASGMAFDLSQQPLAPPTRYGAVAESGANAEVVEKKEQVGG